MFIVNYIVTIYIDENKVKTSSDSCRLTESNNSVKRPSFFPNAGYLHCTLSSEFAAWARGRFIYPVDT